MTLILSGTDGLSDIDGSAATPAIRGTDANTGIFFPAADTIAFAEGGAEVMRINSSGNVGINTTAPRAKLSVTNGTENTSGDAPQEAIITGANQAITAGLGILTVQSNTAIAADVGATIALGGRIRNTGTTTDASNFAVIKGAKENATSDNSAGYFAISTKPNGVAPVERMRIDSEGDLLINTTSTNNNEKVRIKNGNDARAIAFQSASAAECGYIYINAGGTSTTYSTSSDYRLKENIAPMTGALAKVQALKPVTYKWKINGFDGQGFIAHELQEVVPDCVTGVKDAVQTYTDEEGNEATRPVYQGIDTSFLVATLTAAIQELKALTDTQANTITALTARIEALEAP
jgi:hypothetical protein